jgi:hypothetical protein
MRLLPRVDSSIIFIIIIVIVPFLFWQHPSVNNQTFYSKDERLSFLSFSFFYFSLSLTAWLSLLKKRGENEHIASLFFSSSFDVSHSLLLGCLFNYWYFPYRSLQSGKSIDHIHTIEEIKKKTLSKRWLAIDNSCLTLICISSSTTE